MTTVLSRDNQSSVGLLLFLVLLHQGGALVIRNWGRCNACMTEL